MKKRTDMSASSASPLLGKTVRRVQKIQKVQETIKKMPMSTGKVSLIAQYFEKEQKSHQNMQPLPRTYNNTRLYVVPALGPKYMAGRAVCGTQPSPEM